MRYARTRTTTTSTIQKKKVVEEDDDDVNDFEEARFLFLSSILPFFLPFVRERVLVFQHHQSGLEGTTTTKILKMSLALA